MSRSVHSSDTFVKMPDSTWILSDGTMGMMSQSFALAQSLGLEATDLQADITADKNHSYSGSAHLAASFRYAYCYRS